MAHGACFFVHTQYCRGEGRRQGLQSGQEKGRGDAPGRILIEKERRERLVARGGRAGKGEVTWPEFCVHLPEWSQ